MRRTRQEKERAGSYNEYISDIKKMGFPSFSGSPLFFAKIVKSNFFTNSIYFLRVM